MTEADISSRADELLAEMTLAEKAGQLTQYFYFGFDPDPEALPGGEEDAERGSQPAAVEAAIARGEVGSLLFVTDPAEINRLQRLVLEGNRLGIPAIFGYDVIHGLRTILPVPIGLAASWDPETIERGQAVAARESRAVGIPWAFAPMVDIARDPRRAGSWRAPARAVPGCRRRGRAGARPPGAPVDLGASEGSSLPTPAPCATSSRRSSPPT